MPNAQDEAERGLVFVRKINFGLVIDNIATQLALIRTLRGSTARFGCFTWEEFDEARIEQRLSNDPGVSVHSVLVLDAKATGPFLCRRLFGGR